VINVRMEPSLRKAIDAAARITGLNPGPMIRRSTVMDVTDRPFMNPEDAQRIKNETTETRSANFNFVALPRLAEAIKVRAEELHLTVTDYIRAIAFHQVLGVEEMANLSGNTILDEKSAHYHPSLKKGSKRTGTRWDPDPRDKKAAREQLQKDEMVAGYTTYKGKKIVDFVQSAAEKEGLSLSAYQRKLVYQDLEKKYGMEFLTEMRNETQETWDMQDDVLKRMIEGSQAKKDAPETIVSPEKSEETRHQGKGDPETP